jgi:hypothetical protein
MKYDLILRNSIWIILGSMALLVMKPDIAEINTILLIILIESVALALSGIALFVYSRIDFTREMITSNIGLIFLGVHICIGLVVVGVYIVQL